MEYQDFHTHPVNKLIHFFCIPLIVITSINFISSCKIQILSRKFFLSNLYELTLTLFLTNYLVNYSFFDFVIMVIYYFVCDFLSFKWKQRRFWLAESVVVFTLAWISQFIGHYIEGNRPALLFSLSTAVFQAPLFSIKYLLPS